MAKWISFMSTLAACPSLSSTPSKIWQGPDLFSTGDLLTRHPFAVGSGLGSPLCSDPYESSSACSSGISVSLPTEMPSDAASANPGDTDYRVAQVPRTWGGCHPGAAVQKRGQGHSSGPLCPHDAHAGRMPLYHWLLPWGRVHRRTADHAVRVRSGSASGAASLSTLRRPRLLHLHLRSRTVPHTWRG